jgi:putative resolvase
VKRLCTIKEAKRALGVSTRTKRWDKADKIRVVRTGSRRVPESEIKLGLKDRLIVDYARVSSSTQKYDLDRQKKAIHKYKEVVGCVKGCISG